MNQPTNNPIDPDAHERFLLLGEPKAIQVERFLSVIRSCDSEEKKYDLCEHKRDQLLGIQSTLQIEFAFYERVFSESTIYKTRKQDTRWRKFTSTAAEGSKIRQRLKKATEYWGQDVVQRYCEGQGISFVIQFAATARQHRKWKTEALPRLQQLVRRRIELSKYGRHCFVHPIERTDLVNARLWKSDSPFTKQNDPEGVPLPCTLLAERELPHGYGFDQHGLLVPQDISGQGLNGSSGLAIHPHGTDTAIHPRANMVEATSTSDTNKTPRPKHDTSGNTTDGANTGTDSGSDTASDASKNTTETDCTTAASDAAASVCCSKCGGASEETSHHEAAGPGLNPNGLDGTSRKDNGDSSSIEDPLNWSLPQLIKNDKQWTRTSGTSHLSSPSQRWRWTNSNARRSAKTREKAHLILVKRRLDTERLKTLSNRLSGATASYPTVSLETSTVSLKRQRTASVPPDTPQLSTAKQPRVTRPPLSTEVGLSRAHDHSVRPWCAWVSDETYLAQAIVETLQRTKENSTSRSCQTARCLLPILQNCRHPIMAEKNGLMELLLLDGHQAKALLDNMTPDVPIITERQQHFQWTPPARPIVEFFEWIEDHDQKVSVQIPSRRADECSYESRSIRQVQERFLSPTKSDDPWNVLDCSCPLPSTLPDFLTGRNCQLLARIRDKVLNGNRTERIMARGEEWVEWRDLENWALLSEGGHCTAPHMDSHGLATWITIQEGLFGFAWMSRPTSEQRTAWMSNTEHYDAGQQWRYWILKPGQTVFFPSGTIHCVFRVREAQTLALGGHILQWSGIDRWMDVVSQQVQAPSSTNEDMADVWKWIPVVESLIQKRLERTSSMEESQQTQ